MVHGGRACVRELAADGEWRTYPLERVKTMRRGKPGEYRWYNQYRLPPVLGGGTVTVRLDQTKEDRSRQKPFNREEHLRWVAEGEEEFDRLYGIREDSEAGHARMKIVLPWNRALSVGYRAQELDLLGYQVLRNTVALETWRLRHVEPGSCAG